MVIPFDAVQQNINIHDLFSPTLFGIHFLFIQIWKKKRKKEKKKNLYFEKTRPLSAESLFMICKETYMDYTHVKDRKFWNLRALLLSRSCNIPLNSVSIQFLQYYTA